MKKQIAIYTGLGLALVGAVYFASTQPSYEEKAVGGTALTKAQVDDKLKTEEEIYAHVDANGVVDRINVVTWDFLVANPERYGDPTEWERVSTEGTVKMNYPAIGYTLDKNLDAFIPPKPFATATLDLAKARWEMEPANKQPAQVEAKISL